MRRGEPQVDVTVTNIKKLVPACRRCRIRSNDLMTDPYQPVLCPKCTEVIRDEYPQMVPLDKPDFEKARNVFGSMSVNVNVGMRDVGFQMIPNVAVDWQRAVW